MPNMTIDIGNGFYESDSLPFSNQRCVNLYPNIPQVPALTSSSLFNVSGLTRVAITSRKAADANRGGWVFRGVPYFVNGRHLYSLSRNESINGDVTYEATKIGDVDGNGFCSFADNGRQLMIINDQGAGYIYEPTNSPQFQMITDAGFYANGKPKQVVFIDSYFVVTTDLDVAIISSPNDGLSWNALDFISAEADPDGIVAPFVFKNQLYLLGTQTTESFTNIGGAGVPFQRVNGFVLSRGCMAPFSVRNIGNAVTWIGAGENEKPAIWLFSGGEPEKISTIAIDNKLDESTELQLEQSFSWAYSQRGHDFIGFTFNNFTFVYDLTTGRWHERQSDITDPTGRRIIKRCRINSVLNAYNDLFVGDSEDGRIGIIDVNNYTEYFEPLRSFFTTTPLYNLSNSYSLPHVELLCERGVGNPDSPNPVVRLEISRDGAEFENPRTRQLGEAGNRKVRPIWHKNGRVSQYSVFKFTISDPVRRRLYGVELQYKGGLRG